MTATAARPRPSPALEHLVLPVLRELLERPLERGLAVLVDLADPDAIDLLRREARLVALLGRALEPRTAAVIAAVGAPGAGQLAIDVDHHAGIARARAQSHRWVSAARRRLRESEPRAPANRRRKRRSGCRSKVVSSVPYFRVYNVIGNCQLYRNMNECQAMYRGDAESLCCLKNAGLLSEGTDRIVRARQLTLTVFRWHFARRHRT